MRIDKVTALGATIGQWSLTLSSEVKATMTAHILVTRATTSFTLDVTGAAGPHHCIAGIQVTPAG